MGGEDDDLHIDHRDENVNDIRKMRRWLTEMAALRKNESESVPTARWSSSNVW